MILRCQKCCLRCFWRSMVVLLVFVLLSRLKFLQIKFNFLIIHVYLIIFYRAIFLAYLWTTILATFMQKLDILINQFCNPFANRLQLALVFTKRTYNRIVIRVHRLSVLILTLFVHTVIKLISSLIVTPSANNSLASGTLFYYGGIWQLMTYFTEKVRHQTLTLNHVFLLDGHLHIPDQSNRFLEMLWMQFKPLHSVSFWRI